MRKLTVLSAALAALMTAALWGAPAFAQDEQPAEQESTAGDAASGDGAADSSSDAAPAGEEKPAE